MLAKKRTFDEFEFFTYRNKSKLESKTDTEIVICT